MTTTNEDCANKAKTMIKGTLYRFYTLHAATKCVEIATKPHRIVHGDPDSERREFWVVTPADASRLERAGYELA